MTQEVFDLPIPSPRLVHQHWPLEYCFFRRILFQPQIFPKQFLDLGMAAVDPVDAMVQQLEDALDAHQSKVQCYLCLCYHESLDCKQKRSKWLCKGCGATSMMLYRHLGTQDADALGLSAEDQMVFFQQAAETANLGEAARWKTLRTLLVEKKTASLTKKKSVNIGGAYQPLSVWEKLGWGEDLVKSYNDFETAPNGTLLYRVPIKDVSSAEIRQEVEETLALREKEVKKKGPLPVKAKAKAKAAASAGAEPEPPAAEEPVLEIASDSDGPAPKSRRTKEPGQPTPAQLAKAKAREEAAKKREQEKSAKSQQNLASKAIPVVNAVTNNLKNALAQIAKVGEHRFEEDTVKYLKEASETFNTYRKAAAEVNNKDLAKVKDDELGFDKQSLEASTKAANAVLADYKAVMQKIRMEKAEEKVKSGLGKGKTQDKKSKSKK